MFVLQTGTWKQVVAGCVPDAAQTVVLTRRSAGAVKQPDTVCAKPVSTRNRAVHSTTPRLTNAFARAEREVIRATRRVADPNLSHRNRQGTAP